MAYTKQKVVTIFVVGGITALLMHYIVQPAIKPIEKKIEQVQK